MNNELYIKVARDIARAHGSIEVDSEPVVSHSDDGAFVQAWIWVARADLPQHEHASDSEDADYCNLCNVEVK